MIEDIIQGITKNIIQPIISGDVAEINPFISTWNTTLTGSSNNDQITLPITNSATFPFDVKYQGSTIKTIVSEVDTTITFPDGAGIKTIEINAPINGFNFTSNGGDKLKITDINQWGQLKLGTNAGHFDGCNNIDISAVDILDLSTVATFVFMFRNCSSLTRIPTCDTSSIALWTGAFQGCTSLNYPWILDTSSAISFALLLFGASQYDQDLSSMDVSNLTSAASMLTGTSFSNINYDLLLTSWAAQLVNDNVTFSAGNAKYSGGLPTTSRDFLTNTKNWNIIDGGQLVTETIYSFDDGLTSLYSFDDSLTTLRKLENA
jgi:hypothetical protein